MPAKKKKIDPVLWMKSHFTSTPPAAIAAFNNANVERTKPKPRNAEKTMSNGFAGLLPRQQAAPASPRLENYSPMKIPPHVEKSLRAFQDGDWALDAVMTMREMLGRGNGFIDETAKAHMRHRGLKPMSIATTGTPTSGGYLVPDAVTGAIQLWLGKYGAARALATTIPVTTGQASVPVRTGSPTVHYTAEIDTMTAADWALGALGLHVEKRTVFSKFSNELMGDSAIAIVDAWTRIVSSALAGVEDNELINGDGTSTYGGEVGLLAKLGAGGVVTAATGHDTWPELDLDDFAAVVAKLPEQFCNGNQSWLMSTPFYAYALAAMGGSSQGVDPVTGRPLLMGWPVVLTEKMPRTTAAATVCALFGDFASAAVLADRGVTFAASDVAPGAFENGLTYLRAVSRYDLVVTNGGDGSTPGAYVGLKTAS